ncbi:putative lipoprotein [Ahrensia sp. R2A130]|nr:putative lipoprotein [Ahrensia sp. R2A130]
MLPGMEPWHWNAAKVRHQDKVATPHMNKKAGVAKPIH